MQISPNIAVVCDCFSFLERLQNDSVDMVYLDPPWNFEVQDKDNYYEFIFKILQQSYRCLKNTGTLFFYSNPDLNMDFHVLIKKIFSSNTFVTEFIIPKKQLGYFTGGLRGTHDSLLLYTKNETYTLNFRIKQISDKEIKNLFPFEDDRGRYRKTSLFIAKQNPTNFFVWRKIIPRDNFSWKYSKELLDSFYDEGLIEADEVLQTNISLKVYFKEKDKFTEIGTVWSDLNSPTFNGIQNPDLLDRIIDIGTQENDIILDPLYGSGAMIISALLKKRRFLGCENNPLSLSQLKANINSHALTNDITLEDRNFLKQVPIVYDAYKKIHQTEDDVLFEQILKGESDIMEFKESACWNYHTNSFDKKLIDSIVINVAAFLNGLGGSILIGVTNNLTFLDLSKDYEAADQSKCNRDGYELYLNNKIRTLLGPGVIGKYKISFHIFNDCEICKISIEAIKSPVFFNKEFYIRNNNQTIPLTIEQFYQYLVGRGFYQD